MRQEEAGVAVAAAERVPPDQAEEPVEDVSSMRSPELRALAIGAVHAPPSEGNVRRIRIQS